MSGDIRSLLVGGVAGKELLEVADDGVDDGEVELDVAHLVGLRHVLDGEGQAFLRVVDAQTGAKEERTQVISHYLYSIIKHIEHTPSIHSIPNK
jgi:hypothetical protein